MELHELTVQNVIDVIRENKLNIKEILEEFDAQVLSKLTEEDVSDIIRNNNLDPEKIVDFEEKEYDLTDIINMIDDAGIEDDVLEHYNAVDIDDVGVNDIIDIIDDSYVDVNKILDHYLDEGFVKESVLCDEKVQTEILEIIFCGGRASDTYSVLNNTNKDVLEKIKMEIENYLKEINHG